MTIRVPGKAGRRRPDPAHAGRALRFASFWTGAVPAHPASCDNIAQVGGGWQMLGNDVAGDCVAVTWASFRRLMTKVLGGREVYPTQDQVWAIYKTQNPGFDPNGTAQTNGPGSAHDQGMDIQTLLEYLVATGGPDGVKAVAFAKVDHTQPAEVDAALAIFGGLWTGVVVQQAQEQQFAAGQPWNWQQGSPALGGHSILSGGYTTTGQKIAETWAEEIDYTLQYLAKGVEELWLVIWPEHLGTVEFQAGVDQVQLAADYQALTGQPFPITPTPTPVPVPGPGPAPAPGPGPVDPATQADLTLVEVLDPWAQGPHTGANKKAVNAYLAWRAERGYTVRHQS